jgi:hypothetical protein
MIIEIKNKRLGNFIKHIMHSPFPLDGQRCMGPAEELFTEDMVTIEMAKYFYIGEEAYSTDPIPRRLSCTTAFSREMIIEECRQTAILIEEVIREKNSNPNGCTIYILGVGRGLELLLLTENFAWNDIALWDDDARYRDKLYEFFPRFQFYAARGIKPIFKDQKGGGDLVFEPVRLCK